MTPAPTKAPTGPCGCGPFGSPFEPENELEVRRLVGDQLYCAACGETWNATEKEIHQADKAQREFEAVQDAAEEKASTAERLAAWERMCKAREPVPDAAALEKSNALLGEAWKESGAEGRVNLAWYADWITRVSIYLGVSTAPAEEPLPEPCQSVLVAAQAEDGWLWKDSPDLVETKALIRDGMRYRAERGEGGR